MKVKKNKEKQLNPFELHINNKKFTILGRKSKNEVGKPGIARSKSIQKRKKSLLLEYKFKNKSNKFVDRRIGEKNRAMTADDRVIARFTASRVKAQKKMKYNLGEEEDLTHHGQSLSTIEKFEKPMSDDDSDSDDDHNGGKLAAEFVEKAHFGGGVLSRAGDGETSHRDLIDKLIAESKLRKYEKKQLKQETNELTEQLDKDWKELMPVVPTKNRGETDIEDEPPSKKKVDKNSYDILMRSLKFDRRGMASDKLKSEEEIAKEEKERLEKLESERLKRMKGIEDDGIVKHRSADDLDDGFDFGNDDIQPLAYNSEGKPLNTDLISVNEEQNGLNDEENEVDEEMESNEEESDEEVEDDNESDRDLNNDMSDLKEDDVSSNDEETNTSTKNTNENKSTKLFAKKLKEKKVLMDEARQQLPYTFTVAELYEGFQEILEDRSITEQTVIIERMIKVNHPSLGNDNRSNLQRLYPYLLQHLNDNSCSIDGWKILNSLAPHLYDLTQFFPEHAAKCLIEVLKEKHTDFVDSSLKQITSDMLIFLKLVPLLFPSSDYYHPVCTYAVMIASEILSQTKIKKRSDVASCLLLTTILLEYVQLSKRYIPEVVNMLRGMLLMTTNNSSISYVQQFKPNMKILTLENIETQTEWSEKLSINEIFSEKDIDCVFKLTSLYVILDLVFRFSKLCEDIPSVNEIWAPHLSIITTLKINSDKMNAQIDKTKLQLQMIDKKLEKLQTISNRPKALRLYEPRIQKIYDGRTFKTESKEKAERSKLLHRYKREMKSAVREIRKDNSFLSKLKYHEQAKSDAERRNKVKQIYSWGANQAHEINKLAKKNKK